MILMDANILMYAAGAEHRCKADSLALVAMVADGRLEAGIDAEVLQEILHRYRAIGRWKDGARLYDLVRQIVPVVIPITAKIVDAARKLLDDYPTFMARDALHAAVCQSTGARGLCSYDQEFDMLTDFIRLEPTDLL